MTSLLHFAKHISHFPPFPPHSFAKRVHTCAIELTINYKQKSYGSTFKKILFGVNFLCLHPI